MFHFVSRPSRNSRLRFALAITTAALIGVGAAPAQAAVGPPSAPQNPTAVTGPAQITPSWGPPSSNGGSPILGYVATARDAGTGVEAGSCAAAAAATQCTITGLSNGVSFTVDVVARNALGTSPAATVPGTVTTPVMPPNAPQMLTLTGGNRTAVAAWQAPADNGGSSVTSYTATLRDTNGFFVASCSALPASPTCTFSGLGLNQTYTVGVAAQNSTWVGAYAFATATTNASRPNAPRNVTVNPITTTAATINWEEPLFIGGTPITEYSATIREAGTNLYIGACTTDGAGRSCAVTVLKPARNYFVDVRAKNAVGWSSATRASFSTPAVVVPTVPTSVTALPSANTIVVGWTPPTFDGGAPITTYEVTVKVASSGVVAGTCTTDGAGRTCTVSGLTFGTTHNVTVGARNSAGLSPLAAVNNVRTAGRPAITQNVNASPIGTTTATINWTAPTTDGGAPITEYSATVRVVGSNLFATSCTVAPPSTSCAVSKLTPQTNYYVDVRAKNVAGFGPSGRGFFTTAAIVVPTAPTSPTAVGSVDSIVVGWAPPAFDGGAPITAYEVTVKNAATGAVAGTCSTNGAGTTCTVSGLPFSTAYNVEIAARNSAGLGPVATVTGVNTATVPTAPTGVSGTPALGQITVNWVAPTSDGGAPISGYTATVKVASTGAFAGTCTAGGAGTSCTVTGLANATAYRLEVVATNVVGNSPAGLGSASVSTPNRPGTPTSLGAAAGDNSILYTWAAPSSDGGSPVTSYSVTVRTQSGLYVTACTVVAPQTFCQVTGLTAGTAYVAQIRAQNAVGWGPLANFPSAVTPFVATQEQVETVPMLITSIAPEPLPVTDNYDWTIPVLPTPEESTPAAEPLPQGTTLDPAEPSSGDTQPEVPVTQ